jgi:hypothetical protein
MEVTTPDPVTIKPESNPPLGARVIHPAWLALIDYCSRLQHGDIEKLRIQDGLPVLAEVITRKVKFNNASPR